MNVKINIHVDKIKDKVIEQVTKYLIEVGERCIVEARNNGSYTNQTGNLRNSIGYVVMNRGRDWKIKHNVFKSEYYRPNKG